MNEGISPSTTSTPPAAPWTNPGAMRSNNIDFLRFALATLVIFSHSFALPTGNDATEPLFRFSGGQRTFGWIAVDFFFVLSGFLITQSWLRSSGLLSFLWKRVLRVYPAFIVATIVGVFVIVPLVSLDAKGWLRSVPIGQLLWSMITLRDAGLQGAFPNNPIHVVNGSLWSIQYEFWCYIGVAALGVSAVLARRPILVAALFAVSVVVSVVYAVLHLRLGGGILGVVFGSPTEWTRLLPCYLSGMVLCLFRERIPWHPALFALALTGLVIGCRVTHGMTIASPIAGAYVLFSLAFHDRLGLKNFGRFGDFSYGLYVFAFPIQQALVARLGTEVSTVRLFVYSFGLTLAAAVLSWHFVEKPFLRLKSKKPTAG